MTLLKGKGLCVAPTAVCKEEGKSSPRQIVLWPLLEGKGLCAAPTAICKEGSLLQGRLRCGHYQNLAPKKLSTIYKASNPPNECYLSPSLLLFLYTTSDITHTNFINRMPFQAHRLDGQGPSDTVLLDLHELGDSQLV